MPLLFQEGVFKAEYSCDARLFDEEGIVLVWSLRTICCVEKQVSFLYASKLILNCSTVLQKFSSNFFFFFYCAIVYKGTYITVLQ